MNIKESRLNNSNWKIGDVIEFDGKQYEIEDHNAPYIVLRLLPDDERVKPEFLTGRIN